MMFRTALLMLAMVCPLLAQETAAPSDSSGCQPLFEEGRYAEAVDCFSRRALVLEPLGDAPALIRVYSSLGASYVMADKPELGKAVFGKILLLSPHFELDPNRFAPDIVTIFQMARQDYLPKTYSLGYSFLPFGAPQYKNGHKPKAALCALWQAVSLGVSIYGYERKLSFRSDRFGYAEENFDRAQNASRMHTLGFVSFAAAYVVGLVDGLLYKPRENANVETHR